MYDFTYKCKNKSNFPIYLLCKSAYWNDRNTQYLCAAFIGAYQADAGWGSKLKRMRGEADSILSSPAERNRLLEMPGGLPTFEQIEAMRKGETSTSK